VRARYVGGNDEYRLLAEVAAAKPDMVLRVNPEAPEAREREEWLDVRSRSCARSTVRAQSKWLKDAGIAFSFTTAGLDDPKDFGKRVREANRADSSEDALAAVTTVPARQLGSPTARHPRGGEDREPGRRDRRALRREGARRGVWIDGERIEPIPTAEERQGRRGQ
jgi:hypothetical protein